MLTEKNRERIFWRLSLFFVLVSPLTVFQLLRTHYAFAFNPILLAVVCFVSLPLSLLVDMVLIKLFDTTSVLRFWVVKPVDEVRHVLSMPVQDGEVLFEELLQKTYVKKIAHTIQARLTEFGFQSDVHEEKSGALVIVFRKSQQNPVLSFIDHAFFGEAHVGLLGAAVDVRLRTTFDDTLILETGEFERLRALGNYLALKTPQFSYKSVPLTIYCGLNLAFVTTIVGTIPYLSSHVGNLLLTCMAAGAGGLILAGLVLMQRRRERMFGYRLAFAALYLGLLPFAALLVAGATGRNATF